MLSLFLVVTWMPSEAQLTMHDVATEFRHSRGLAVQRLDEECCKLAQAHADRMANGFGLNHGANDQIIAYNYNGSLQGGVTQCMNQWTNSGPHAAWLYGGSEKVGWGYAVRGSQRFYCGVYRGENVGSGGYYSPTYYSSNTRRGFRPFRWMRPWRRR